MDSTSTCILCFDCAFWSICLLCIYIPPYFLPKTFIFNTINVLKSIFEKKCIIIFNKNLNLYFIKNHVKCQTSREKTSSWLFPGVSFQHLPTFLTTQNMEKQIWGVGMQLSNGGDSLPFGYYSYHLVFIIHSSHEKYLILICNFCFFKWTHNPPLLH